MPQSIRGTSDRTAGVISNNPREKSANSHPTCAFIAGSPLHNYEIYLETHPRGAYVANTDGKYRLVAPCSFCQFGKEAIGAYV